MVNIEKLRAAMEAGGVSIEEAASALGVNRATLYRRLQQAGASFTLEEVSKLADLLHLTRAEMETIFFDRDLA